MKRPDRIHWHYCASPEPELSSELRPYCKTTAMAQLWLAKDWTKVTCSRCLWMKQKADGVKLAIHIEGMRP